MFTMIASSRSLGRVPVPTLPFTPKDSGSSGPKSPNMPTETLIEDQVAAPKKKPLPLWNVVLLDDDAHTYEYVIEMLHRLFGHPLQTCFQMAREVDLTGRVIVFSTHRERAELERDRIHSYGADPLIPHCKGSMSALIEPAPGA